MSDDQYREDYELLRDEVIDRLNPPDDDVAEVAIMIDAVARIAAYVDGLPCYCTPEASDFEDDPCLRCEALGRVGNVAVQR